VLLRPQGIKTAHALKQPRPRVAPASVMPPQAPSAAKVARLLTAQDPRL